MEKRANEIRAEKITFIGGVVGLAAFLMFGLLPSLVYGGYAGVILGGAIFGTPIHESVFAQATVVLGILSGVLAMGGGFIVAGAIVANGVYGTLTAVLPHLRRSSAANEAPELKEGQKT